MRIHASAGAISVLLLSYGSGAAGQTAPESDRLVIDFGVRCHGSPTAKAEIGQPLPIMESVHPQRIVQAEQIWYLDSTPGRMTSLRNPSCWVPGLNTGALTTGDNLSKWLATLDHQLGRNDLRLADFVYFDNLLTDLRSAYLVGERVAMSGLVRFKMLQLLDRAIIGNEGDDIDGAAAEPLNKAWLLAHGELVDYFSPSAHWLVRADAYWRLYESNQREPWADDLAWVASQHGPGTDECEAGCVLKVRILQGPYQYWIRFPSGTHIGDALRDAAALAKYAETMGFCYHDPNRPGKTDLNVDLDDVNKIRASLADVSHPSRMEILSALTAAEQACRP